MGLLDTAEQLDYYGKRPSVRGGDREVGMLSRALDYSSKVVDGASIRFNQMLDDPGGTAKDVGLGMLNSLPGTVSAIGDLIGVDTRSSDSASGYLKSKLSDKKSLGFDVGEIAGIGGIASLGGKALLKGGAAIEKKALVELGKKNPELAGKIKTLHNTTLASHADDVPSNYVEQRIRNWYGGIKGNRPGVISEGRSEYISGINGNSTSSNTPAGMSFTRQDNILYADKTAKTFLNKKGKVGSNHDWTLDRSLDRYVSAHEQNHQAWKNTKYAKFFDDQIPNGIPLKGRVANDPTYFGSAGEVNARADELLNGIKRAQQGKLTKNEAYDLNRLYNEEVKPFIINMGKNGKFKGSESEVLYNLLKSAGKKRGNTMGIFDVQDVDLVANTAGRFREVGTDLINTGKQYGRDGAKITGASVLAAEYVKDKNDK